jgi:hypothetical protein
MNVISRVRVLLLVLLLPAVLVGPLATTGRADTPPPYLCTIEGETDREPVGSPVRHWNVWVCRKRGRPVGFWVLSRTEPGPSEQHEREILHSDPPYRYHVNSGIAYGAGSAPDLATASYAIQNPSGTRLIRRIAVHLVIYNSSTGAKCSDTGWREAPTERDVYFLEILKDLPNSVCGNPGHQFQTWARGRFYSTSLNAWQTTPWVLSGNLTLPPPVLLSP